MMVNTLDEASKITQSGRAIGGSWQAGAVIGFDVGGAHIKGALVRQGCLVDAVQVPAPLWQGLERIESAITEIRARLQPQAEGAAHFAVTITAELTDAFATRREGVTRLAEILGAALGPETVIYAGPAGFLPLPQAARHVAEVASANWHATAAIAGNRFANALMVDVGSTTADLIPIVAGHPAATGYGDAERLASGELLYTGATRTFVMAVADRVPFAGRWQPLMNEYFASMADVRRLTGELPDGVDQHATADGRGKSLAESRARLARMVGFDVEDASDQDWRRLAAYLGERQLASLTDAASLVLSRGQLADDAPVIGAGIGDFLTQALAARLGRDWVSILAAMPALDAAVAWAGRAAPAAAIALLAARSQ